MNLPITQAYNQWAEQYDSNDNKTRDLDKVATIDTLQNYAFDTVLELGCGTGKNTVFLLEKAKKVVGLDFSEEMLKKAKEKITHPNMQFQQADLNKEWEVKDNYFDLITSNLTLEHIKNFQHIFQQAQQKLKQNGHFFISELHPIKQYIGSKARFETDKGLQIVTAYTHHLTDYLTAAKNNGFQLLELKEYFDKEGDTNIPRLIVFVFGKV